MWTRKIWICAALLVALGTACTQQPSSEGDPKRRLNDYISRTFGVKSVDERPLMMAYLTGEAKARLAVWSDDQFRQAFIDSKREFVKLIFNEAKTISPNEMNITYELSYIDNSKGSGAKITNKKLCILVKEQNAWFIKDVRNIKELVEYKNEMTLP